MTKLRDEWFIDKDDIGDFECSVMFISVCFIYIIYSTFFTFIQVLFTFNL